MRRLDEADGIQLDGQTAQTWSLPGPPSPDLSILNVATQGFEEMGSQRFLKPVGFCMPQVLAVRPHET
jgi:hypothetical protein